MRRKYTDIHYTILPYKEEADKVQLSCITFPQSISMGNNDKLSITIRGNKIIRVRLGKAIE